MATAQSIQDLARKWLREDKDDGTRREIQDLLDGNKEAELELRLRNRIAFGTAGLRAAMKAGYAYMNPLTVTQASQGLADYILHQPRDTATIPSVVVGYDGRHNSAHYARLVAATFASKGFTVYWFGKLVHTPLVPFTVKQYNAAAGVMITASHNPKNDNGYKVYWSNGSQIIPPHDHGIASRINVVNEVLDLDLSTVETSHMVINVFDKMLSLYMAAISVLANNDVNQDSALKITYTAMHGVGLPFMRRAAQIDGLEESQFNVVDAQALPDPEFPTVPFPNPEEKGALTLAIAEADKTGSTLVIANDPDADRFSAAQRLPNGQWHQFSGNQLGILFAAYVLESLPASIKLDRVAMLASTVSSRMLAAIAKIEGFHFQETLTGFKWLGNVGQDLVTAGYEVVFAYEEAIGFMFPGIVWDKDGVAAGTAFIKACQKWQQQGMTPWQKLQNLYERYGYFEDANTYLISPSPEVTTRVFNSIRTLNEGQRPQNLGLRHINRWRDLTSGYDTASGDNKPDLPADPSAQMITCELDNIVFTVRGSGTEPKIKLYIEATSDSAVKAKSFATSVLDDLLREWFEPGVNGLRLAGH